MPRRSKRIELARNAQSSSGVLLIESVFASRKARLDAGGLVEPFIRGHRRGRLNRLPEMPLDILFLIFSELHPADLLELSRMTKSLRNVLMRRSARSIWTRSLSTVGLPKCPQSMDEPAYASFIYDEFCWMCLSATSHREWAWLLRSCFKCSRKHLSADAFISSRARNPMVARALCVSLVLDGELDAGVLQSNSDPLQILEILPPLKAFTYLPEFYDCGGEYERVSAIGEDAMVVWMKERMSLLKERIELQQQVYRWERQLIRDRQESLAETRAQRYKAIQEKLYLDGWKEELEKSADHVTFRCHPIVKQNRPLTQKVWLNNRQKLNALMERVKAQRLYTQNQQLVYRANQVQYNLRIYSYAEEIIPGAADVFLEPTFSDPIHSVPLWKYMNWSWHIDFQGVLDAQMGSFQKRWKANKDEALRTLFPEPNLSLDLATVFFKCRSCEVPIPYPHILMHDHVTDLTGPSPPPILHNGFDLTDKSLDPAIYHSAWFAVLRQVPWGCDDNRIRIHKRAIIAAASVVDACGFNAHTTSRNAIAAVNPYVQCLHADCNMEGNRSVMQWQRAIIHAVRDHAIQPQLEWRLLDQDEKEQAIAMEGHLPQSADARVYRCLNHCKHFSIKGNTYDEIKQHLQESDQTNEPKFEHNYTLCLNADLDSAIPQIVKL